MATRATAHSVTDQVSQQVVRPPSHVRAASTVARSALHVFKPVRLARSSEPAKRLITNSVTTNAFGIRFLVGGFKRGKGAAVARAQPKFVLLGVAADARFGTDKHRHNRSRTRLGDREVLPKCVRVLVKTIHGAKGKLATHDAVVHRNLVAREAVSAWIRIHFGQGLQRVVVDRHLRVALVLPLHRAVLALHPSEVAEALARDVGFHVGLVVL